MTNREKMLRSALKLFAAQGIDKTATAQITSDVGLSSGALFAHFKTKQELIDTLYLQIKKDFGAQMLAVISEKKAAEENVKKLIAEMTVYFLTNYDAFIFIGLMENDPKVSQKAVAAGHRELKPIFEHVEQWKRMGVLKNVDEDLLKAAVWSNVVTVIKYCKSKKIKKATNKMLELALDAVRK